MPGAVRLPVIPGNVACWAKYALSAIAGNCQPQYSRLPEIPTLLIRQVSQFVCCAGIERIAVTVETILKDDSQSIGSLHQYLND